MSLDLKKNRSDYQKDTENQKIEYFFQQSHPANLNSEKEQEVEDFEKQEEIAGKIFYQWEAFEFEQYVKSKQWYLFGSMFILAIVIYALVSNSPIMAITFILIGIVGYIQLQKEPRTLIFSLTSEGILAGKELYSYENIDSFWIFYEANHAKIISLHTKAKMLPFTHIPLGNEDPVAIREKLLEYIPEIKQEHGFMDMIEKILHI